jgi:hypothetical protein
VNALGKLLTLRAGAGVATTAILVAIAGCTDDSGSKHPVSEPGPLTIEWTVGTPAATDAVLEVRSRNLSAELRVMDTEIKIQLWDNDTWSDLFRIPLGTQGNPGLPCSGPEDCKFMPLYIAVPPSGVSRTFYVRLMYLEPGTYRFTSPNGSTSENMDGTFTPQPK